jgi:hypothetical protein
MTDRARSAARPVLAWLGEDAGARALALRAERSVALQAALSACAPLPGVVALDIDAAGVLRVAAPSASAAAQLRQQGPSLMAELQRRGWPVTGLRVRPQPLGGIAPVPVAPPRPPMPASAVAAFAELERDAPEGALKEALAELLRHARQPRR